MNIPRQITNVELRDLVRDLQDMLEAIGVDFQESVNSQYATATPPVSPADRDRYILTNATPSGWNLNEDRDTSGTPAAEPNQYDIVQYDATAAEWFRTLDTTEFDDGSSGTVKATGAITWVEDESLYYVFTGSAWEEYNPGLKHLIDGDDPGILLQRSAAGGTTPTVDSGSVYALGFGDNLNSITTSTYAITQGSDVDIATSNFAVGIGNVVSITDSNFSVAIGPTLTIDNSAYSAIHASTNSSLTYANRGFIGASITGDITGSLGQTISYSAIISSDTASIDPTVASKHNTILSSFTADITGTSASDYNALIATNAVTIQDGGYNTILGSSAVQIITSSNYSTIIGSIGSPPTILTSDHCFIAGSGDGANPLSANTSPYSVIMGTVSVTLSYADHSLVLTSDTATISGTSGSGHKYNSIIASNTAIMNVTSSGSGSHNLMLSVENGGITATAGTAGRLNVLLTSDDSSISGTAAVLNNTVIGSTYAQVSGVSVYNVILGAQGGSGNAIVANGGPNFIATSAYNATGGGVSVYGAHNTVIGSSSNTTNAITIGSGVSASSYSTIIGSVGSQIGAGLTNNTIIGSIDALLTNGDRQVVLGSFDVNVTADQQYVSILSSNNTTLASSGSALIYSSIIACTDLSLTISSSTQGAVFLGLGTSDWSTRTARSYTTHIRNLSLAGSIYDVNDAAGTSGQVLTVGAGGPEWTTPSASAGVLWSEDDAYALSGIDRFTITKSGTGGSDGTIGKYHLLALKNTGNSFTNTSSTSLGFFPGEYSGAAWTGRTTAAYYISADREGDGLTDDHIMYHKLQSTSVSTTYATVMSARYSDIGTYGLAEFPAGIKYNQSSIPIYRDGTGSYGVDMTGSIVTGANVWMQGTRAASGFAHLTGLYKPGTSISCISTDQLLFTVTELKFRPKQHIYGVTVKYESLLSQNYYPMFIKYGTDGKFYILRSLAAPSDGLWVDGGAGIEEMLFFSLSYASQDSSW